MNYINQENNPNFLYKSIYLRLAFESHFFHGQAWNYIKYLCILFLIKY